MQVMGVDPFEALVLPRFVALLVTIPLLTFVATLAGLFGGMMVETVLDLGQYSSCSASSTTSAPSTSGSACPRGR